MKSRKENRNARRRGSLLGDALLAIGVIMLLAVAFAANSRREANSQEDRLLAAHVEILSNAAKTYVGEQYDAIREDLVNSDPAAGGDAIASRTLSMDDLIASGYLSPSVLSGNAGGQYGQEFTLFIRGVRRSDTSFPQSGITKAEIIALNTPDANGVPSLINGKYESGDEEMDIEAVLLSQGGEPIPLRRGNNITASSGSPTLGYVQEADSASGEDFIASGNLASFQMPLSPWEQLGAVPEVGQLLSLVSLSDGVSGMSGGSANIRGALQRCYDLLVPSEREACLADGNKMYSNIVFSSVAPLSYDEYPGISGLKKVSCRDPNGDNRPTGTIDETTDVIYVDCGEVVISENLTVQDGDVNVNTGDVNIPNGTLTINGNSISDNLIMATGEIGNSTMSPAVTEVCPLRPDGSQMEYRVEAWVTGIVEPVGRPLAGYRMVFDEPSPGVSFDPLTAEFRADVITFVNEDHCVNVSGNTLSPMNTDMDMQPEDFASGYFEGSGATCGPNQGPAAVGGDGDGYPDAYYANRGQAKIQYAVYCE